ncbi:MAG: toxin-activating lysine-acyltransferase [Pseudomonadota bacterium]
MQQRNDTIAEWLTLHRLESHELLGVPYPDLLSSEEDCDGVAETDPIDAWLEICRALEAALRMSPTEREQFRRVRLVHEGPGLRSDAPVTIADTDAPTVHVRFNRSIEDIVTLAHEAGHAAQLCLSEAKFIPPAYRELGALIAEDLVGLAISKADTAHAGGYDTARLGHRIRYISEDRHELETAIRDGSAPYSYRWNYPVAAALAEGVAVHDDRALMDAVFRFNDGSIAAIESHMQGVTKGQNPLPPIAVSDDRCVSSYATIGAAAILLMQHGGILADETFGEFYTNMKRSLQGETIALHLNERNQPSGFVLYADPEADIPTRIVRPYGTLASVSARRGGCRIANSDLARSSDIYTFVGYAIELLSQSTYHRTLETGEILRDEILPPLGAHQFKLYLSERSSPEALVTWAWLSEDVEADVHRTGRALRADEWACGDRLFLCDWITPYDNMKFILKDFSESVFPDHSATSIRRRSDRSVRRINRWLGANLRKARTNRS